MGFVQSSLLPGEKVIRRAQLSWMPLFSAFVFMFFSLIVCTIGIAALPVLIVGLALLFFAILGVIRIIFVLLTTVIVVTNQRLLAKTGFISRSSIEVLLTKLESVEVAQGIQGRIFNYGTVRIHGTGSSRVPFKFVKSPMELRRACVGAADGIQRATGPAPAPALVPQPSGAVPLFEVKIADPSSHSERWIEVRAANADQARDFAVATGAIVGEARLKSIA